MKYKIDSTRLALLATLLASLLLVALMRAYAPMRANDNAATANITAAQPTSPPKISNNNQAADATPTPLSAEDTRFGGGLWFKSEKLEIRHTKRKFTIKVEYPQLVSDTNANDARVQSFNRALQLFIKNKITREYPDVRDAKKEKSEWADFEEQLNGNYEVSYASDEIISVVFSVFIAPWGAAGASGFPYVFNYDFQKSRQLYSRNIFKPRSGYVRALMSYCEPILQDRYGGSLSYLAVAQRAKEYEQLGITKEGVNVVFDEGSYAPTSAGIHSVLVPFEVIKDKLNPRSPVARLASM
ncbi:MAG: DUF4163 domain-containing protein, partial [Pyrinomonadaceae bacterium]|nr:DUF4163 domain-containing protein [Pyrinomonadaceae bacterium]